MRVRAVFGFSAASRALRDHRFAAGDVEIDIEDVKPIHKAFPAVVNDHRYDLAELAIVTFLQAFDAGRPLALLPVTMLGRFQHHCLVTLNDSITDPAALTGKRVGVRSWSQTTGVWVRGIFADQHGLDVGNIDWVAYEDGHVAGAPEPGYVTRTDGKLTTDFLDGSIDAAILGNELPADERVRTVLADPAREAARWYAQAGAVPINHMAVVSDELLTASPKLVAEIVAVLASASPAVPRISSTPDLFPAGFDAVAASLDLVGRYAYQQGVTSRLITAEAIRAKTEKLSGLDLANVPAVGPLER